MNHDPDPRLLVIDPIPIGAAMAFGRFKERLLQGWSRDGLAQLTGNRGLPEGHGDILSWAFTADPEGQAALIEAIRAWGPEAIYYRLPDRWPAFNALAEAAIEATDAPLIVHLMDDMERRTHRTLPDQASAFTTHLRAMLERATRRLAIGASMAEAFEARYGCGFEVLAHGVEPAPPMPAGHHDRRVLRYFGNLDKEVSGGSVHRLAEAVEGLPEALNVHFEVFAPAAYHEAFTSSRLKRTVIAGQLEEEEFRGALARADLLVLAYNFDGTSLDYVRYSIANKLGDYLGAGRPILALGPRGQATIDWLAATDGALMLHDPSPAALSAALRTVLEDPARLEDLALKAQAAARQWPSHQEVQARFRSWVRDAAQAGR